LISLIHREEIQQAREAGGILVAPGVSPRNSQSNDPMSPEGATEITIKTMIGPLFLSPASRANLFL
jgi:orotidine-5'-phosphate decarboxylase